ncbi:hypothetical protein [Paenibacillus sp. KN14-4R]|uniref:hypothetical protein n=1 Tax=Paenibacillus sp. KN14-4R TaxID=3445773 RepID=UPI003F9F63E4
MKKLIYLMLLIIVWGTTGCNERSVTSTMEPTPAPVSTSASTPSPTPSAAINHFIPYADHVPINEEVMSREERKKLDELGQEVVALLDDYVYVFNLNIPQKGEDKFGSVDPAGNFFPGKDFITIKATPTITSNGSDVNIAAYVEVRHEPHDVDPYWKGKKKFRFTVSGDGSLRLGYWNESADDMDVTHSDYSHLITIMPNEKKIADLNNNRTYISVNSTQQNGDFGIKVSTRYHDGDTRVTGFLPTTEDWENHITKNSISISALPNMDKAWILLHSDPGAGMMSKSLYTTENNGTNWIKVTELDQTIDGYVTGVSFRDENVGWITATQHGAELLPLYRTKDGGKSWTPQKIEIPQGYKYGNCYPPVFDATDLNTGQLVIEYVSDLETTRPSKRRVKYTTNDGGDTWLTNEIVPIPPTHYLNPNSFSDPIKQKLMKVIVQNLKAFNERDKTAFVDSFSKKATYQKESLYDYLTQQENMILINMEKPEFDPKSTGGSYYAISLQLSYYDLDTNEVKKSTSTYYFDNEENNSDAWKIGAID